MAIKFEELRKYVARNVRLSICFEDIKAIVEYIQNMPGIAHITTHINSNPYELYIQRIMKK